MTRYLVLIVVLLAACTPRGQLTVMPEAAGIGTNRSIFVATTRSIDPETGRFGRDRSEAVRFARYDISIPPERELGDIAWPPRRGKPDPERQFVTTAEVLHRDSGSFRADLSRAIRAQPRDHRDAVIFVHGFNNTFSEGLYRIAQLSHDLEMPGVTVHYSWPSAGNPLGYVYDRDSMLFARDGLERLIEEVLASGADRIVLVAHSMGSSLTMEALRQVRIRGGEGALRSLGGVVLISPDIDVDVFRSQALAMEQLPQPFIIFGSSRDRILNLSARLTGEPERLGNLSDVSRLADLKVTFLDTAAYAEGSGHFTLATSPALISVIGRIGDVDAAFAADRRGRVGLLPGVVLTVQNATEIILAPVGAVAEELAR